MQSAPTLPAAPAQSSLFDESRKRFQEGVLPHIPILTLDRDGNIQSLTRAARAALEYAPDDRIDECFFSHVHKRNMRRVMRDLAHIVCRGKQRAQWLLRLRTGNNRWRWYRASARNHLGQQENHILVRLRSV